MFIVRGSVRGFIDDSVASIFGASCAELGQKYPLRVQDRPALLVLNPGRITGL